MLISCDCWLADKGVAERCVSDRLRPGPWFAGRDVSIRLGIEAPTRPKDRAANEAVPSAWQAIDLVAPDVPGRPNDDNLSRSLPPRSL
jgi:hypothetical protein